MKIAFHIILLLVIWITIIKIIEFKIEEETPNILRGGVNVEESR